MTTQQSELIPDDFPRHGPLGTVSGVQPKLPVRKIGGKFVNGLTDEELFARYDNCSDLVEQLAAYTKRKLDAMPGTALLDLLLRVRLGVENKGWDVSSLEMEWIFSKVAERLGMAPSSLSADAGKPGIALSHIPSSTALAPMGGEDPAVETLVQRALRGGYRDGRPA